MEVLRIHTEGKKDHIEALRAKYNALRKALSLHPNLSDDEKKAKLKKLSEQSKKEIRSAEQKLF